jgi:hypothetical protein
LAGYMRYSSIQRAASTGFRNPAPFPAPGVHDLQNTFAMAKFDKIAKGASQRRQCQSIRQRLPTDLTEVWPNLKCGYLEGSSWL